MNIIFDFSWCSGSNSIQPVFHMLKILLDVVRIVVPIGLIVMTTLDISKKVINPDEKDGQQKILLRAIAALIVFLLPTIIDLSLKVIDWGTGRNVDDGGNGLSSCWKNA